MRAGELSQRYVDALNRRDFDAFRALIGSNVHFHLATAGVVLSSPDEIAALYRQALAAAPDARIVPINIVSTDDWAAIELNIVRTGSTERHSVFHRWEDDKLVYYHNYVDPSGRQEQ
jgi:hypothetical protein